MGNVSMSEPNFFSRLQTRLLDEVERLFSHRRKSGDASSYLMVLALMGFALMVRLEVAPVEAGLQYLTFFPAVALSVIVGGLLPGLLAIAIGMALATFVFVPPYYSITLQQLTTAFWSNLVFMVDGLIVCAAVVAMHRYQDRMNNSLQKLERTRYLIETTSDGFWLTDTEGKLLDVNANYCRMSGYTHEELLKLHVRDLEAIELPDEVAAHTRKILLHGCDVFETRHRRKDGSIFEVEISASYLQSHGEYFAVFVRDISDRKRIQQQMEKAKDELQALYDGAPCGYHSLDAEGRFLLVNQTEADWLGYAPHELIGRKASDFYAPPSTEATFATDFARFVREGSVRNFEITFAHRDGTPFTVLLSADAVYDEAGNYLHDRATMMDVSDLKKVRQELFVSEERFRQLFDKAPLGIAIVGQDRKIETANPAFCALFGYIEDELRQRTILDITEPEYHEQSKALTSNVLQGSGSSYALEKKLLRKDGSTFWGRVVGTEIRGQDGETRFIMGMVEDVTERIEREQSRLVEVQQQRDVLVREVHHRIKNNLQGVVGLLRQQVSAHPEMQAVIEGTISRIYSIAIIHGLQANTLSEEVDLGDLLQHIVAASGCDIEFDNQLSVAASLVRDEAVPIALALNELITNACKHRRIDTQVSLQLRREAERVAITISNSFAAAQHTAGSGQGLGLVQSLLPRQHTKLNITTTAGIYCAALTLSPPVVRGSTSN